MKGLVVSPGLKFWFDGVISVIAFELESSVELHAVFSQTCSRCSVITCKNLADLVRRKVVV